MRVQPGQSCPRPGEEMGVLDLGTLHLKKGLLQLRNWVWGFPGGAVVKNLLANAGDTGSSPGLGRSHMPWSN